MAVSITGLSCLNEQKIIRKGGSFIEASSYRCLVKKQATLHYWRTCSWKEMRVTCVSVCEKNSYRQWIACGVNILTSFLPNIGKHLRFPLVMIVCKQQQSLSVCSVFQLSLCPCPSPTLSPAFCSSLFLLTLTTSCSRCSSNWILSCASVRLSHHQLCLWMWMNEAPEAKCYQRTGF